MLDAMISWTVGLFQYVEHFAGAAAAAADVPNPGEGEQPPFAKPVVTVLKWGMWGGLLCCVGGFIIVGGNMALKHKRGEGGGHVGSLVIVSGATIVVVTAYQIVQALVGASG